MAIDPTLTVEPDADGRRVRYAGRLTVARILKVDAQTRGLQVDGRPLTIDLSAIERLDTTGAWLIHRLATRFGATTRIEHASPAALALIDRVAAADQPMAIRPDRSRPFTRLLARVGHATIGAINTLGAFMAFLGATLVAFGRASTKRHGLRWHAIVHQMEIAGVNALPIIALMSFLVGIVIAQQGAVQLAQFGAEVFVINLVGRSTFRELGILLTAIMVAGRSASAFAAQIGSMKLGEEIDALETIGLSPIEVLVVPRVIAMLIMLPLLGFVGSMVAITGGGLFAWFSLGIPPVTFVQRIQEVVPMSDFWIGMAKAPAFALAIAVTGCFQGMQVSGNAESVGERTTAAVVQSIFMVIVLDAFFAVFFTALGFI